jgi:hypothetical protein
LAPSDGGYQEAKDYHEEASFMADAMKSGDRISTPGQREFDPHPNLFVEAHAGTGRSRTQRNPEADFIDGVRRDLHKTISEAGWLSAHEKAEAQKYADAMVPHSGRQNTNEMRRLEKKYEDDPVMDPFLLSLHEKATLSFD